MDILLSPVILFFLLGVLAAAARSDLSVPEPLAKSLSLYLMAAIGLKGGVQVSQAGFSAEMGWVSLAGMGLSFAVPFMAFALLRSLGGLDRLNAAAVSAHYGSVSLVTFVTASDSLTRAGMAPAGYLVAVMALMETPAIVSGLLLARTAGTARDRDEPAGGGHLWREVLLNGSVVLLLGAFLIGLAIGKDKFQTISPVFVAGFTGLLCLFMLDMGLIAMRRFRESRRLSWRLVAIALALPLVNGAIGLALAAALGLDPGTGAAFALLAASASYIAVPAAIRLALPDADPGIYLSMSLAVTFPFNILAGIPLFSSLAVSLLGWETGS
ncbi:sodium-dependent bicarbonate transport family permease [Novosphingobium sp. TH158]|uniref:sodium-dependent bicarbonate transport family permease n=1 Tax=Novosphingobium sp. TH158 TaxID=2067455 RepID=UPI000C7A6DBB|nr:sodium-dependent bicarbonate transport family permease [Novosphingobium sp. TH158]PLK27349.1 sodium-dependent bicarbonate transport family permease [Novosphingobium sp. TH158]